MSLDIVRLLQVSSYSGCLSAALDGGYEDGAKTYSLVSGGYTSALCLGGFFGPTAGGFLYDQVGFRGATVLVQGLATVSLLLLLLRLRGNRDRYQEISDQ